MGNPRNTKRGGEEDPLHAAARSGDLQTLQTLCISNPLSVNSRDKHSRTPLHLAAWSGQTEVVAYLCQNKADVGAAAMDDMGAIHFAAQKGHQEIIRILLSSGVSIKASNRKGLTAMHYAAQGSNLELVKYLVRKGASLTARTKAGKTPLDLAKNEEIVSFLKECEDSLKKGKVLSESEESSKPATAEVETEECNTKASVEATGAGTDDGLVTKHEEEESKDEKVKRMGEAENEDDMSKPKKPKIVLNHLLASDDTIEEN